MVSERLARVEIGCVYCWNLYTVERRGAARSRILECVRGKGEHKSQFQFHRDDRLTKEPIAKKKSAHTEFNLAREARFPSRSSHRRSFNISCGYDCAAFEIHEHLRVLFPSIVDFADMQEAFSVSSVKYRSPHLFLSRASYGNVKGKLQT